MANTDQAGEPTMEEILSSIRRIISDDNEQESGDTAKAAPEADVAEVSEPETAPAKTSELKAAPETAPEPIPEPEVAPEPEPEAAPEPEPEPEPENNQDDDIFDLVDVVADEPAEDLVEVAPEPEADVDEIDFGDLDVSTPEPSPEPVAVLDPVPAGEALVDAATQASTMSAFSTLANTLLSNDGGARTLEDLVQEMLRPMLKSWLDENLPALAERLVQDEIERIARGR